MKWLLNRMSEGSTWAGLGLVAVQLLQNGVNVNSPAFWGSVAAGIAATLIKDKGTV